MTAYAPLFSHEANDTLGPHNMYLTAEDAARYGRSVAAAQPGIEYELMYHRQGPNSEWRSVAGDETIAEVRRRRWQDPPAAVVIVSARRSGKTARARAAQQAANQA